MRLISRVTRGDGGQNLIGPELGEKLGVIRTQELLAARRLDHGRQFFTRAVDFGFSKNAAETLRIWDRDKILADIVWVIRRFRPDVIVTRFSPDDDKTHGHHTASAILAREAFQAAGDPKRFPEQLAFVEVWKPTRLVWNTSPFFFSNRNIPFDPTGLATIEAGGFSPLLGKAFTEIAAASVSMHKSQGVGRPPQRGARKEYFKVLEGAPITSGLFDGVDTTWARVPKSEAIAEKVKQLSRPSSRQIPPRPVSEARWNFAEGAHPIQTTRSWGCAETGRSRFHHRRLSRAQHRKLDHHRRGFSRSAVADKIRGHQSLESAGAIARGADARLRRNRQIGFGRCRPTSLSRRTSRRPCRKMSPGRNPTGSASRRRLELSRSKIKP